MQMVSECSGHEFNLRLCEWPAGVFGVPAHVNSDMAHGKIGWKSGAVRIDNGFEAQVAANLGGSADPIVALFQPRLRDVAHVKICTAPKTVGFGFQRFVDKAA